MMKSYCVAFVINLGLPMLCANMCLALEQNFIYFLRQRCFKQHTLQNFCGIKGGFVDGCGVALLVKICMCI